MSRRLFTPEQVNGLVPRLSELMGAAMERRGQATALYRRLEEERERIRTAGGGMIDEREWKARAERLDGLMIEIRAALEAVQELGGVVKDLELGLVDFPGRVPGEAGDEMVNLCWKHGEAAVGHWHRMDEGYAQRRPLP